MSFNRWLIDNILNPLESFLYWLFPRQWKLLQPVWYCRFLLSEGKRRRLLRKAVVEWDGYCSTDYFRDYDMGRNLKGKMIVVTIQYRDNQ